MDLLIISVLFSVIAYANAHCLSPPCDAGAAFGNFNFDNLGRGRYPSTNLGSAEAEAQFGGRHAQKGGAFNTAGSESFDGALGGAHRAAGQHAHEASEFNNGGFKVQESHDHLNHRTSLLAAGEDIEAKEYHVARKSVGSGGAGASASGGSSGGSFGVRYSDGHASHGGNAFDTCGGVPTLGKRFLCCGETFYGDTFDELSCCGTSIFDTRFYGCSNSILAPIYRPIFSNPASFNGAKPLNRMCGNYVYQVYDEPYELCCEGVHYPNPYGYYGCCGPRCFDSRYYYCGHDAESKSFRVYRRTTYLLAATEETEIEVMERKVSEGHEGAEHEAGFESGSASGGGHAHAAAEMAGGKAMSGLRDSAAIQKGGQLDHGYDHNYHQYYGAGLPYNALVHRKKK